MTVYGGGRFDQYIPVASLKVRTEPSLVPGLPVFFMHACFGKAPVAFTYL